MQRKFPIQENLMPRMIVVDDEQAKIITDSSETIEIRDRAGKRLGYVAHGFSEENLAIARQRFHSDEPRFTTQQVLAHLQSLAQS